MEDKPWENEELKKSEEALPRLKECELENLSRLYKAKTGVGCDGYHSKIRLDVAKETRGEIVEFLDKSRAEWEMAAASLLDDVLLDSEDCH